MSMSHSACVSSILLHNRSISSSPGLLSSLHFVLVSSPAPSLAVLRAVQAILTVSGACANKYLSRRLIALYAASPRSLPDALHFHAGISPTDPISVNLIFKSLVRLRGRSAPHDAFAFFCSQAHPVGCRPGFCTFPVLISAAKLLGSLHQGEIFHCLAMKVGILTHLNVSNSLIHMYTSCDALTLARQLFDEMPVRDLVSYNSLVDGYVKSCDFDEAERLFWSMPVRSVISWSTLFNGYVRNRMFHKGIQFFHQMLEHGFDPDDCCVVSLLFVYSHFNLALHGKAIHGFLIRKWERMPVHVSNSQVSFYCKCGLVNYAIEMFERIPDKDLICWNTLISGLGGCGQGKQAISVFGRMLQSGMKPDDITFLGVLVACSHSLLVEEGHHYFKIMHSEYGIKPSFAHYWCLVDLYVRLGNPHEALKAIQGMPLHNQSAIWGAVISLAKVHGDISVGECLGKRLIELEPNNSRRYVPLVNLYAAASQWDKYKELQELMKARGLKKLPDCTLIDLNVVVHKFSVGDKSQPEIQNIYEVLEEIAGQLNLLPAGDSENVMTQTL